MKKKWVKMGKVKKEVRKKRNEITRRGKKMERIINGEYKIKTFRRRYTDSDTRCKEIIKYRKVDINAHYKIEEGQVIEYYEKEGEGEYKPAQQHLIGYSYLSLIDKRNNEDLMWIQGNKGGEKWMIAKSMNSEDWEWKGKNEVIKEFLKLLQEKYKVKLIIQNSEIL